MFFQTLVFCSISTFLMVININAFMLFALTTYSQSPPFSIQAFMPYIIEPLILQIRSLYTIQAEHLIYHTYSNQDAIFYWFTSILFQAIFAHYLLLFKCESFIGLSRCEFFKFLLQCLMNYLLCLLSSFS